jgi:hypothetical protein
MIDFISYKIKLYSEELNVEEENGDNNWIIWISKYVLLEKQNVDIK